jgi:hypothetical protein
MATRRAHDIVQANPERRSQTVEPAVLPSLTHWESFYVIVGSSGAALTGLQFVVIALGAEARALRGPELGAFGTPTIVHFCAVLLLSAILSAPWHAISSPALILGAAGAGGVVYTLIVLRRARRQTGYKPVLEDWIWHTLIPLLAYGALLMAAIMLPRDPVPWLVVIGATSILLLFTGIHNAWDAVTFIAVERYPTHGS